MNVKHDVRVSLAAAVFIPAVIAVVVAATEPLAEVVVVIGLIYIKAVVAEVCVLIGVRVLVIGMPAVLAVGLAGPEAFAVTVVHCLPQHIGTVLIDLIVVAAALVPVNRGRVIVGITIVVAIAVVLKTKLFLSFTL